MSQNVVAMLSDCDRVAAFAMDAQCSSHGQLIVNVLNHLRSVAEAQILIYNTEEDGLPERKSTALADLVRVLLQGMLAPNETIGFGELTLLAPGYYRLDLVQAFDFDNYARLIDSDDT